MKCAFSLGAGAVLVSCLIAAPACSSSSDGSKVASAANGSGADGSGSSVSGANGSGANGSGANGSGANGSGANGSGANGSASAGTGPLLNLDGGTGEAEAGAKGTGSSDPREVCDGVDNDGDGIIDNVDKNKDGVCDCLLIATLGVKGGSGQGDVLAAWLTARSDTGATDLADQTLTPELLAKFQVIVAQGKGHVFLWGDEWITYNSEWNDHPDYQVQLLWLNAIKWLTAAGECQVAIPPNPPK